MSGTYSGSDKRLAYLFENGGGGGSTTVIANPSGEATDDLEKLQVGETIYDIPTGGSSTLAGLGDVNLSSPTDGQVLKYDETNDEWVNGDGGSSSNVLVDSAVDENNLLYSSPDITNFRDTPASYTATEDCYVYMSYWGSAGTNMYPKLNDKLIGPGALQGNKAMILLPIKKGDTISHRHDTTMNESCFVHFEIYGRKPASVVVAPIIYSQEEREVGVWEDGKPLYQKTCIFTGSFNQNMVVGNINVSDIDKIPVIKGATLSGASDIIKPLTFAHSNANNNYSYFIRPNGDVEFRCGSAVTSTDTITCIYLIIEYTKTTDTAGSGSWTPSGAPAVHYSTDEQVVGTWIDGKTLYQKTIKIDNVTTGTVRYNHGISNIDDVTNIDGVYVCWKSEAPQSRPLAYTQTTPSGFNANLYAVTASQLVFDIASNLEVDYILVTLQYTKSS